jgi:hypothetical protein
MLIFISPALLLSITNAAFAHHGGPHGEIQYVLVILLASVGLFMVGILATRLRKGILTNSIPRNK